jgi:hypothetical protein
MHFAICQKEELHTQDLLLLGRISLVSAMGTTLQLQAAWKGHCEEE